MYNSEHGQDKWLNDNIFHNKRNGIFVEFGAMDGVLHSNSLFYEKELGWKGLCVEANPFIYSNLKNNRSCYVENYAIAAHKGIARFKVFDLNLFGWSGLEDHIEAQHLDRININIHKSNQKTIDVNCVKLEYLLEKYGLFDIDYMSIDVEGAEYSILFSFPFAKFNIEIIDVENNFNNYPIESLMKENGYTKIARLEVNDIYRKTANCNLVTHALAISTYMPSHINQNARLDTFKQSINSLVSSEYPGKIIICDDGSPKDFDKHLEYCSDLKDVFIYQNLTNGGQSKTKNLGIKLILELGCEFGFLCDDDLLYQKRWWEPYLNAYKYTNYGHYSYYNYKLGNAYIDNPGTLIEKNGVMLRNSPMVQGAMLTFSKEIIEKIGYFKIFPFKVGHEHSNFSVRCVHNNLIPGFLDVENSTNVLDYVQTQVETTTRPINWEIEYAENEKHIFINLDRYEQCITSDYIRLK